MVMHNVIDGGLANAVQLPKLRLIVDTGSVQLPDFLSFPHGQLVFLARHAVEPFRQRQPCGDFGSPLPATDLRYVTLRHPVISCGSGCAQRTGENSPNNIGQNHWRGTL